jgi:xyloglucan-specific exo-beta-1,4-glucanase
MTPWLDWGITKTALEESPKLGWMTGGIHIDAFNSDRMFYGTGATLYGSTDFTNWDDSGKTINISVAASGIEETAVSTTSLDFAESNPKQVIRMGNVDTGAYPNDKPIGVSTDAGQTWSNAGTPADTATGGSIAMGADGEFMVWAPDSSGMSVYFAQYSPYSWKASTGLPSQALVKSDRVNKSKFYGWKSGIFYSSTDGGATFTASKATGMPKGPAKFKAVPGSEGDVWLAGGSTNDGDVYGLWHSTDSGATFTKLANVEQADLVGFGKAASGKSYPAIYVQAKIGGIRGFHRSDDSGTTWTRINDNRSQFGATNGAITGDPNLYGRVYIGTNGCGVVCGDIKK